MEQTQTPTSNNSRLIYEPTTNGKRNHQSISNSSNSRPFPTSDDFLYRECLRNHAASLGGHALDGCGEFMPSPTANPAEPTSLRCAACGCHRNFHRRLPHHHSSPRRDIYNNDDSKDDEADEIEKNSHEEEEQRRAAPPELRREMSPFRQDAFRNNSSSVSPPPPPSSGPQMLMALSHSGAGTQQQQQSRKRFRTKFTPDQKEKMQVLSERLGWRIQKRDEGVVEEWCREIGVTTGVFKVWMHNNKQHFLGGAAGSTGMGAAGIPVIGNGNGSHGHVINASSSSS